MKRLIYLFVIFFILALPVFAQTAAELEGLLSVKEVSYAEAARLVLQAADVRDLSPADAFRFASEQKWLPAKAEMNGKARLDGVSFLIMNAFDMPGGFVYSMAKNPHHAYRELAYREILLGRIDPAMAVSGDYLLFIIGRVLTQVEELEDRS